MTDKLVASANFATWVFLYLVTFILAKHLWQRCRLIFWKDVFDTAMAGAMLGAFSWATHRVYWWLWRTFRAYENHKVAEWFIDNGYLTLIAFVGVWAGASMLIAPVMRYYLGDWWFAYCMTFALLLFGASYSTFP